jgi:hypothetical protein
MPEEALRVPQNIVGADLPENIGVVRDLKSETIRHGDPAFPDIPGILHLL